MAEGSGHPAEYSAEIMHSTTRAADNDTAEANHGRSRHHVLRGVAITCAAVMAVTLVASLVSDSSSQDLRLGSRFRDALSLSSLQEAPAGTPAPAPGAAPAPEAPATAPAAAPDTATAVPSAASAEPVDCSGEPGGCMGTHRASKTLLPLAIFGLVGACLYWSYLKFIQVPGYSEAREKKVRTVVFSPARRAYDTFGHEVAGPV